MMIPAKLGPWKISHELGRGEFSSVYACSREGEDHGETWCMKASPYVAPPLKSKERKDQTCSRLLSWENQIYSLHAKDHPIFPRRPLKDYYASDSNGWRYLVLERIDGGTVRDRVVKSKQKLAERTVFSVGVRLLAGLKHLHDRQYLFRDLKPENVMTFKKDSDESAARRGIVLVDFGACTKFTDSKGDHFPSGGAPVGTPLFMGIHVHESSPPGRRDDLESLGYLMAWILQGGKLPWSLAKNEQEILQAKKELKKKINFENPTLNEFMAYVMNDLARAESKPDYEHLERMLIQAGGEMEGVIDWEQQVSKSLIQRKKSLESSKRIEVIDDDAEEEEKPAAVGRKKKKKQIVVQEEEDDEPVMPVRRARRIRTDEVAEEADDQSEKKKKRSLRLVVEEEEVRPPTPPKAKSPPMRRRQSADEPQVRSKRVKTAAVVIHSPRRSQPKRKVKSMILEAGFFLSLVALVYSSTIK